MDGERLMVKDWDQVFYYAEAYKVRDIQWGRWPACRRSLAYSRLAKTTAGHTAMWVFGAIVGMLHKRRSVDGLMVHENEAPFSVEDIRTMAELTTKQVVAALALLRSKEIGWIRPEAEERERRAKRDQPGGNRATPGQQPGNGRAETGLEERRREKNTTTSGFTTTSDGTPETGGGGDEAQEHRKKALAKVLKRPWWLGESKRWIDSEATANEIVTLLWSLPNNGGTKLWNETLAKAEKDAGLKSPAAFVISTIRAACGKKKAGGAA